MKKKNSGPKTYQFNLLGKTYRVRINTAFGKFIVEKDTEMGFKVIYWPNRRRYYLQHNLKVR